MLSKMPWGSSHEGKSKEDHDTADRGEQAQSLTTILATAEDRTNLLLLIADCTESMRKTVTDTFDPEKTNEVPKLPPRPSESDGIEELTSEQRQQEEEDAAEAARKEHDRRVKELSSPQMQDLKTSALVYFDDWRDRVLERVGEAVNAKPDEANDQKRKAHATATQVTSKTLQDQPSKSSGEEQSIGALAELYPPRDTRLIGLEEPKRILILHSLLLLVLSLESYPSESRLLLLQVTSSLGLPLSLLTDDESKVARGLLEAAQKQLSADAETKKAAEQSSSSRKWKVGLGAGKRASSPYAFVPFESGSRPSNAAILEARSLFVSISICVRILMFGLTVAGAALIGVTGGLAAPLLAAGVGTVMGGLGLGTTAAAGYLGALAGSAPLVGVLFGAYGGRMTSQMVDSYAKEVTDFAFLPVRKSSLFHRAGKSEEEKDPRRLRVTIGISGWLTKQEDIVKPWQVVSIAGTEPFALRWEMEALMDLGNSITTYVKSAAWSLAKKEIISRTIFGALSAGLWPLGLVKMARVVDNPFSVARARSDKAGAVLADALINKIQGERPVTLIGYSLGARVVYACLQTLADRKAFGLVESVVLLGGPTPSDSVNWRKCRSVVSGRVVNAYSTKDYLLGFLYRSSSLQYGIAGLQAIQGVVGIENVDVSNLVDGHTRYRLLTGAILKQIGMEDIDVAEVQRQEKEELKEEAAEEEERKRRVEAGEQANPEEMEKEVQKKNSESMSGWIQNKMSGLKIGSSASDKDEKKISEGEKLQ